ncbi:hypothetical protein J6590_040362 [Homalodisca vitripennis]|nr:hypothetical protein J6590_040362 [Homalodisca vitripennis]
MAPSDPTNRYSPGHHGVQSTSLLEDLQNTDLESTSKKKRIRKQANEIDINEPDSPTSNVLQSISKRC